MIMVRHRLHCTIGVDNVGIGVVEIFCSRKSVG
jgi:hypothetical protein